MIVHYSAMSPNGSPFGAGTLDEAFTNICEGGTITFAGDLIIDGSPNQGYNLAKGFTLDGAGFNVNWNLDVSVAAELLSLNSGNSLYIFKEINIFKPLPIFGEGAANITIFNVASSVELILIDVRLEVANEDEPHIINDGETTIISSQLWGTAGTGDGIENNSVMLIQNSTIDVSINNSADLIIEYSTVFANDPNHFGVEGGEPTSGLTNSGNVKLNANIMVSAANDCSGSGTFEDLGYNIFANGSACSSTSGTTQTISPTLLFTDVITGLVDNGGSTFFTHALQPSSPAPDQIARGNNDCGVGISADQRGIGRPQNALCDIGSYEVINNILPVAVDDSATTDEEIVVTIDVLANDSDADFDTLTVTDVTQPVNGTAVIVNNGNDTLYGDTQDDWLFGGNGKDTLYGGAGWDDLEGGNGADTLYGEAGYDLLLGSRGADNLSKLNTRLWRKCFLNGFFAKNFLAFGNINLSRISTMKSRFILHRLTFFLMRYVNIAPSLTRICRFIRIEVTKNHLVPVFSLTLHGNFSVAAYSRSCHWCHRDVKRKYLPHLLKVWH